MAPKGIEFVSYSQFENNLELKGKYGNYENFLKTYVNQLSTTSAFTFAKSYKGMSLPNSIRDDIWSRSKKADVKKANSEETYTLAVRAEHQAKAAQEQGEAELERMMASYEDGDSHITNAQTKLKELMRGTSDATLTRELAGEQMVASSKASLRAFQSGMLADASLNALG